METETREIKVSRRALPAVENELSSLARLRCSIDTPPWWKPWASPKAVITGPSRAVAAAAETIAAIEYKEWFDHQW